MPLLAFTLLAALLTSLPATAGIARAAAPSAAPAADADDCAPLALAPFGDPGDAVGKATVPPDGSACFTVTATEPGRHLVSLDDSSNEAYTQMLAEDGTQVDCHDQDFAGGGWCDVPAAGTYTVQVVNNGWEDASTAVTVVPLGSTRGCAEPTGTSWDQPTVSRTSVSRTEVDCLPFEGRPGERVHLTQGTKVYGDMIAWITDETGTRICPRFPEDGEDSCVLPGDGPYRVLSRVSSVENGFPAEYTVKVRRLNAPQGCRTSSVRPYGPLEKQDFATNPCFTFPVTGAGEYVAHAVSESDTTSPVRVYDSAGLTVCRGSGLCRLPETGTYTAVVDDDYAFRDSRDDLVVLDRASDAGCVPIGTGLYRGELRTAGQYDCLRLSVPKDATIAGLIPLGTPGVDADVEVLDKDGTTQCGEETLAQGNCALTGTAPYRTLVHADDNDDPTGPYSIAFHRTDAANDCPVLPAGSFADDGAKATLTTGDGVFSHCLNIPADAHTEKEILQLTATSGAVAAKFSVVDSTGKLVCDRSAGTNVWVLCDLTPGKAHTVLVTGRDQAAAYTLTRRDVTASAASAGCTRTAAANVGGPSVPGTYGAAGTLRCHQITTDAATDVLHVDVRDPQGTANIAVLDGDGDTECSFRNRSCAVTGFTTHQVLVQVPATLKPAPEYHLDALRIATADGPAAECAEVPSVAYGYGPITGTLNESHTAVCAALPTAGFDRFDTEIKDTTGATTTAVPALYNTSSWANGCTRYLPEEYDCAVLGSSSASTPTVFVLGLPEKASTTAYSARLVCASVPCGTDDVGVTSVSPTTGVSGSKVTLTVTGTALPADAQVRLARSGTTLTAKTESVSEDHRTLKATLDLAGVPAGTWSVSVIAGGWEYQRGTFTVTPAQLKNTTAPEVTGTTAVGDKVTAAPGSWSATPSSYTYQWNADGLVITDATAATYRIPASLLGKKLTVTVAAAKEGWDGGTATSPPVTVANGAAPRATEVPAISGTAKVGRTLKASKGTWSPAPTSYSYQWYAGGTAIRAATTSSLVLKGAQLGKKITVKVTAHRTGHHDGSAVSRPTRAVTR
ncbi:IPT/TIG domain-containing protein [Streptomyces acidicola]|uniref:IPT/TIG domain-containing protein n=1 Tax=Streptomyces acidicola TaxID=2596892 RepID=UPI002AD40213|nr:IPT/TIG domain-containing protein [Streptomyces acidicola]